MTRSQVTLKDIAAKVKVSKVTVSKALRGHPDISPETSRRVMKAARELGYVPNYMARNLSSRRSNTIGVVVPKIAHFFFSAVIEAIYDAAFEHKYEIILTVSQENAERELKHIQSMLAMRVDGLIISISQMTKDQEVFKRVRAMGVPLTFMDRVMDVDGCNTVISDDAGGAYAATEQALKLGYTRLAHIGGYSHINIGRERSHGFERAVKDHGIHLRPEWLIRGGFGEEDGYRGFKHLWSHGEHPEFILAVTYPVALGIYRAARELGVRIPNDVDIMGFGNSTVNEFMTPPMSYVEQPTVELGRKAFELTLENIRHHEQFKPQHLTLPTKLVMCETCVPKTTPSVRSGDRPA